MLLALLLVLGMGATSFGAATKSQPAATMRFQTLKYIDQQGIGIEAFRLLIPADWQFEGSIRWVLDNPGMPAFLSCRVRDPKSAAELEVFPNQPFCWSNNPTLLSLFPIGSRYYGNEVHPPIGPLEALKRIVLPRFRGDVSNLRIVKEQMLPELAKSLGAGRQAQPGIITTANGAKIRIEYTRGGKALEEEIYGVTESVSFPIQSMMGVMTNTIWVAGYLFSFKAEKGKLDAQAKVFQTMIYSFRLNPQWFSKYQQVIEHLAQMEIRRIQHIGQLSRIISQTQNEISDMMMQSYNQRQAVNDRLAENFSQYIRGVDKYYDPIQQQPVELPTGYQNAWTNNLGEYIVSDRPSFNPNIGSTKNWTKLKRTQ